jgi:hypothetical protein
MNFDTEVSLPIYFAPTRICQATDKLEVKVHCQSLYSELADPIMYTIFYCGGYGHK